MKTGKLYKALADVLDGGCCSTVAMEPKQNAPCCELPSDDSYCCDKTETVNSEETDCY